MNTTQLINELQPGEVCLVAGRPRTGRSSLIFNLWWQDSTSGSSHWRTIDILHDSSEKNRAFRYEEAAAGCAERGNRPALFRMEFYDAVDDEIPSREEMKASFKELKRIASKYYCTFLVEAPVSRQVDYRDDHKPIPSDILFWDEIHSYVDRTLIVFPHGYYEPCFPELDDKYDDAKESGDKEKALQLEQTIRELYTEWAENEKSLLEVSIYRKGHFCSSVVYNWKKGEKAEIADHAF